MITDYGFNKTVSADAKLKIKFLDEMHFDIHAKGKSSRDRNLMNNYFKKRALLASGNREIIFLPQNPNEFCDKVCWIIQEQQGGNDTKRLYNEKVAIGDKFLDYKCITPSQHKKLLGNFNLLHTKKKSEKSYCLYLTIITHMFVTLPLFKYED